MSNRLTRFPGLENKAEKAYNCAEAGNIIIAYDRKMKKFVIKEVKEYERDWLLRLKVVSHTNIDLMISHGDINSENILLSKSGEVKLANVGERLLEQPREHNPQEDVWSLGLLLIEMLEPDSIFLEPFPTTLQRPDSTEPCTVNFLSRTRFDCSSQLQQHEFLQKSRGGQYLKPFISDAERFMPLIVEKLDIG
ncbi:hypothetical protein GJ744_005220 [Endocarpon pusillum]|uniref:Protein kinase domain-containing protein n=1 Tax=Endocarpon pusillum TaxID=364733 RepID=A0A8H7A7S0_9EURO|nr:hypothetical protein GJ744_005220 [Endocarpon pusillum]